MDPLSSGWGRWKGLFHTLYILELGRGSGIDTPGRVAQRVVEVTLAGGPSWSWLLVFVCVVLTSASASLSPL